MKSIVNLSFFFGCILLLFLSSKQANAQADAKAKAILDGVTAQTKSYQTIRIEFSYVLENKKQNIKETLSGVAILKGDKYHLKFMGQTIFCDGKKRWVFNEDANEVQVYTVNPNDDENSPAQLLTSYDKSYEPKFIKEAVENGVIIQTIDLKPLKAKKFYKIRIRIDKTKKQIVSSVIYDKDSYTTYTYTVKKFEPNVKVLDSQFVFDKSKYPGVEIIDMQ